MVAEHADLWNVPGGDIDDAISRSALLDRLCAEIGRDPAVDHPVDHPAGLLRPAGSHPGRDREGRDGGFRHFVLALASPYPDNVARWVADEIIGKSV